MAIIFLQVAHIFGWPYFYGTPFVCDKHTNKTIENIVLMFDSTATVSFFLCFFPNTLHTEDWDIFIWKDTKNEI